MPSPKIEFAAAAKKTDAMVLPWFQEEPSARAAAAKGTPAPEYIGKRSKEIDALTTRLKESKHFAAKKGETDILRYHALGEAPSVLLLGLGNFAKFDTEIARHAGAALYHVQKRARAERVALPLDALFAKTGEADVPRFLQALLEGYALAGYEFVELKKKKEETADPQGLVLVGNRTPALDEAVRRARLMSDAVNFARGLGDKPGNYMTPTLMAKEAQKMAKEAGLKCRVLGRPELEKEKMGLLLGVGKGSDEDPKLIVLEHQGGKKTDRPIALVGKGVTFDSGGISIKPAGQMEDMKYDMMGAAAVIGVMQAVAKLKLPLNVTGFVAAAENMPSGTAQKPGDVARSRNGKTVEIVNTDAEGRLILADALEYAQEFNPQAILDFATLTGAVVVALGTVVTGIMGTNRELIERIKKASAETGERVWELPLFEEYEEDLKSHYADIRNSGSRDAGSSKGGTFLKFFVDKKYPWVHFDIAGTAYHRKDLNYCPPKFASGVMVRLITQLLEQWRPLEAKE